MANVKNIILKKKIGEVLYDLMVNTTTDWVNYTDEKTLKVKLDEMDASIKAAADTLADLTGDDTSKSIAGQISTAITNLKTSLENEEDASSLAGKIKANKDAIAAINDSATGILALAKKYADDKVGLEGTAYATAKAYTDHIKEELQATIAGAFHFKGSVDYVAELDSISEKSHGDVYQVKYRGASGTTPLNAEYAWDGTTWVELGSIIDLSAYSTTEQMTSAINTAKAAAIEAAATDATSKANTAKTEAIAAAATDATSKANTAKTEAIAAAAEDATTKANAAQTAATEAAKTYTDGEVEKINTAMAGKCRFLVGTVVPEDLTSADLFGLIVE